MLKAVGPTIIVKADPAELEVNGIIVAVDESAAQAAIATGLVVSVGDECFKDYQVHSDNKEPWCKPGDYVIYSKYAGKNIHDPYMHEDFVVMLDGDVKAVIQEGEFPRYQHPLKYKIWTD